VKRQITRAATVVNQKGLHARAAAKFAKLCAGFKARIRVERGEFEVDGRSIMGLMMLAATPGTEILIHAEGPDAEAALDALVALVEDGFGEEI
jgi:phosphocarrier protein